MLIAIAADLHDNLANWQIFQNYIKKQGVRTLLFCGDLTDDETLQAVCSDFNGEIYLIAGNADNYRPEKIMDYPNIHFLGRYGWLEIDGLKIGSIHELEYRSQALSKQPELNYLFYGHTHKPWLDKENQLIVANPGTLGGVFYKACFTLLDTKTKKLELKILERLDKD